MCQYSYSLLIISQERLIFKREAIIRNEWQIENYQGIVFIFSKKLCTRKRFLGKLRSREKDSH